MGLCYRRSTVFAEMPHVSVETRMEKGAKLTIYHTPEGDVFTSTRSHVGRIADGETVELQGLIKTAKDYDPLLFMIEDTVFHRDDSIYHNTVRDIGGDGIFRDQALDFDASPYGATKRYFGEIYGLDEWVYHQRDHRDRFEKLVDAQTRRDERRLEAIAGSPAEFLGFGWIEGLWRPDQFRKYELPFYKKWVPYLQGRGKLLALHCDACNNLRSYAEAICETGVAVVEAYTPPPVSDLPLIDARKAWKGTVLWINFPETIFWSGAEATKEYTIELLRSAAPGDSLVLGFTEMGVWGATDDETECTFKSGTLALMDAIDEHGRYPIRP